jgi:hypothetical protein
MSVPALTPRGFWIRVVVFTAALLVYTWAAFIMARKHFWFGVGFVVLPILLGLARVIVVVVMGRPSRHPR